ncbi:MAG: LexA family transcriptional regulator [Clostridia bacterium]|nr:LexA family transcriptional regulator [Clostridia bacterium]
MSFAERVKAMKAEKNMTSEQLSRAAGIPLSTLNKVLAGVTEEPKLSLVLAIADAFACPVGCLLDGENYLTDRLDGNEQRVIQKYRKLDAGSRELVEMVMDKELERAASTPSAAENADAAETVQMVVLPLYFLPASAGTGTALDENGYCESIEVRATKASMGADYAIRVSGDSMEPKFEDGDILLVRRQNEVAIGDLGIFVADGEGYFKRFLGEYLRSFNPQYQDIWIENFAEFRCCGKVIGRMRRRRRVTA